jgi:cell division septation protein DedD
LIDVRRSALPPEDYALARALAGDTEGATEILETAIRAGEANVRTRQNLAFIYALSGRWVEARTMAGLDMAPNAVSDRIGQWAMLVRSGAEKERVAMLLGVTPVIDPGQPHQLARRSETPLEEPTVSADAAAASSTYVAEAAPAEAFSASTLPAEPSATYEVDPALKDPAPLRMAPKPRTSAGAFKAAATSPLSGRIARQWESSLGRPVGYVVQLGAFRTAQGAASGWQKIKARHGALRRMDGRQAQVRLGQGVFYRLSVALNSRGQAQALCQSMRGQGSPCFVRTMSSGDMVRWAAPLLRRPSQLALRQRAPISRAGDRPSS